MGTSITPTSFSKARLLLVKADFDAMTRKDPVFERVPWAAFAFLLRSVFGHPEISVKVLQ
jgi:hypothetical protein